MLIGGEEKMSCQNSSSWEEHEKYQLWLAYQVRTPLKILEPYFNRSISAINKFLSRSGIRQSCKVELDQRNQKPRVKTFKELEFLFLSIGMDNKTVQLERNFGCQWSPSEKTKAYLFDLGVKGSPPWKVKKTAHRFPVSSLKLRNDNTYVSLETCCHYLARHGVIIKQLKGYSNPLLNWKYLLNGKPTTDMGILRETNKLRLKNKEPIFHVKNLTVD